MGRTHLISNAIKYSHRGQDIVLYSELADSQRVAIGIRTRGVQIQDSDRERIFLPGFRTDDARRMDSRGMGIGLSVCRQLAEILNGRAVLRDDTGEDTVFELILPR